MDPNDNGNPNDTLPADGSATPQGTPGTDDAGNGSIANQNGNPASGQPNGADPDENKRLKGQIAALQRQLIQARRSPGTPQVPSPNGQPNGQPDGADGEIGQKIAIAYEIADGQLRRQMEDIYALYPELTADELRQIRRNPWAYCSREAFMQGDVETAKLEIEQHVADLVEGRANGGQPTAPVVPAGKGVTPNPAPAPVKTPEQETQEDWNLPMDKLEQKVAKLKAQKR